MGNPSSSRIVQSWHLVGLLVYDIRPLAPMVILNYSNGLPPKNSRFWWCFGGEWRVTWFTGAPDKRGSYRRPRRYWKDFNTETEAADFARNLPKLNRKASLVKVINITKSIWDSRE